MSSTPSVPIIINATMDQVIYKLCQWSGDNFIETYLPFAQVKSSHNNSASNLLLWNRYKLNTLGDLEEILSAGDIFSLEDSKLLIDYQDLELNPEAISMINRYSQDNPSDSKIPNLILYSLNSDPSTTLVKLFQANEAIELIDYKQIQKDKTTKELYQKNLINLASDYNQQLQLELNPKELNQIVTSSSTYREVIDHLDFLSMTDKPAKYIQEVTVEEKPMLFMMPFGRGMSGSTLNIWKNIPEGEMQLSLSLAYTKLLKAGEKDLIREVIDTDYKVKISTKFPPLTLWKYLLWKVIN